MRDVTAELKGEIAKFIDDALLVGHKPSVDDVVAEMNKKHAGLDPEWVREVALNWAFDTVAAREV